MPRITKAEIRATFSGVRQPVLELVMSSSSPGRYAVPEFAKNGLHPPRHR